MSDSSVPVMGGESPWGRVQSVRHVVEDAVVWVSTAGHGGFWLSPRFHECLQSRHEFETFAGGPWYEEDCDAAVVVVCFAKAFSSVEVDRAMSLVSARPSYYGAVSEWVQSFRESQAGEAVAKPRAKRARPRRSVIDEAAEACGLVKVRGALGGVYYE